MPLRPPGQRVAAAQPLAALPPYGCGVPLAGKAERAEGGTSGTLVTEILGAPQRETGKEELVKCVPAPRSKTHPRRGNPPSSPHRTPPRPSEIHRKPAGTISRRPRTAALHIRAKLRPNIFSFPPGAAHFLFDKNKCGAPPRPARWGEEERPSPRSGRGSALGVQGSGRSFRRRRKRS